MAQRRSQNRRSTTTTRKPAAKPAAGRDVTQYADKAPTAFHKFFARWITEQVGYAPERARTKRAAFLAGVSISTAARQAFQASPELAEWREETGEAKRGPKPKDDPAETKRRGQRQNVSDEEFEPEEEEETSENSEVDLDELEEELNNMAIGKLRATAKEHGVTAERGWKKDDFIDAILATYEDGEEESDEDDDEEDAVDLDELAEELDALTLTKVKQRAKEYGVTPKRGEDKEDLIERILASLEDSEEDDEEDDEEDEPEEEEESPAKSRSKTASKSRKGKPSADDEDDDEFLF